MSANNNNHEWYSVFWAEHSVVRTMPLMADVALIGGGNWNTWHAVTNAGDVDADGHADFWTADYQQIIFTGFFVVE